MELINLYSADTKKFFKRIKSNSIDLIVTDPPYKITPKGCVGNSGGMMITEATKKGKIFKENSIKVEEWMPELFRVLKEQTHCYVMCNHVNLHKFLNVAKEVGFKFSRCLIWDKGNKIMGGYYMSQFEYILFLRKGKAKRINNCGTSDLISIPNKKTKDEIGKNIHDTEKPIELMKVLIENSSKENEWVLDPFMGVGSTGIASKLCNRKFIGIELDEKYFKIAKERINSSNVQIAKEDES